MLCCTVAVLCTVAALHTVWILWCTVCGCAVGVVWCWLVCWGGVHKCAVVECCGRLWCQYVVADYWCMEVRVWYVMMWRDVMQTWYLSAAYEMPWEKIDPHHFLSSFQASPRHTLRTCPLALISCQWPVNHQDVHCLFSQCHLEYLLYHPPLDLQCVTNLSIASTIPPAHLP